MPAHTHIIKFSISAGAVIGPLFSLSSFPQFFPFSFVPRLHIVMSRSCLWGVHPGRSLVFWALLFFCLPLPLSSSLLPYIFFSFPFVPVLANYILPLPTSVLLLSSSYLPPTLPTTITSSSPTSSSSVSSSSLGERRRRRWRGQLGYRCVLMKQWRAGGWLIENGGWGGRGARGYLHAETTSFTSATLLRLCLFLSHHPPPPPSS